jgi:hypothetical protein
MPRIHRTKRTRLIYCEGAADKAFLECIKSIYASETYNVDIRPGNGGDQINLAETAVRVGSFYEDTYLKIDGDRDYDWENSSYANVEEFGQRNDLIILKSIPMLEKLLVNILEPSKSLSDSRWKGHFERTYITASKRTDEREYKRTFTQNILEEARVRLPELQALIDIF